MPRDDNDNFLVVYGILACVEWTYSDFPDRDRNVSKLAMEFAPEPGMNAERPRTMAMSFSLMLSTQASVSFSLLIFRQSKETMTLDIKATKARDPMTPAKTTDPIQIESTSS